MVSLGTIKSEKDLVKLWKLAENLVQKLEQQSLKIEGKACLNDLKHEKAVYDGFGQVVDTLMLMAGFAEIINKVNEAVKSMIV